MRRKTKDLKVTPSPAIFSSLGVDPVVWRSDNFARDWFADALQEARSGKDFHEVRREIIFAACFLESYIFEWTRRRVQIEELDDYFPPKPRFENDPRFRRTLRDKWKYIPKELFEAGKLSLEPELNLSDLGNLLKYRHGLVHAAASRPATDAQPRATKPFPTKDMLKKLNPGWAVRIAVDLIKDLHNSVNDTIPDYIEYP